MKINTETIVTLITSILGVATMCFGLSADTAEVIKGAVPTVVGGIMTLISTITYIVQKSKNRVEAAHLMVYGQRADTFDGKVVAQGVEKDAIEAIVRKAGLV